MSDDYNSYTRVNRFEKKRKNTKAISILGSIGGVLVIVLIGFFIFGGNEEDQAKSVGTNDKSNNQEDVTTEEDTTEPSLGEANVEQGDQASIEVNEDIESEGLETVPSSDDNVVKAYKKDWQPVGTEQQGEHVVSFEPESQDWQEMMRAVRVATNLTPDDMIQWWVTRGNDDQSVVATVSNNAETEIYRVYVSWADGQGWKPTLVEELKENDQKDRFAGEDDSSNADSTEDAQDIQE
ncbi:YrrS family protein [Aquibacillus kalidii]|uniref:YrrS family protein n=1 Tax=Aquibacillus kalidii TaxID=2762597 RepID=UPI001644E2D1|nr:YrrS family protein [Aquibacillus kalidii]